MSPSPFLPLPSTLSIDTVEQAGQTLLVWLYATTTSASCPRCGTPGSRVHSRYTRTVADVACGGQHLALKLLVRKWVCAQAACPQRLFAEGFPGLVQRYARMTDRLRAVLQFVGTTTNGADGARLVSSLAMPTTGKTIIRHVLQLPLPKDAPVRVAGVDEWAWKRGHTYGTILVDLEAHRVAALLADRSVESTTAWFEQHPEVEWVSRDRGKLYRDAAERGAPQARHIADRFHLQQNLAEALKDFFRRQEAVLKRVASQLADPLPSPRTSPAVKRAERESKRRHAQQVRRHKRIWKLFRAGARIEDIARLLKISSQSVYRALKHEEPPPRRRRRRTPHLTDPYLPYLGERWNAGCHSAVRLYEEVAAQGYTGSKRLIEHILAQWRPSGRKPVSPQSMTQGQAPSARSAALMLVRPAERRTKEQVVFIEQLCQSDETSATACALTQAFGQLLRQRQGVQRLEQWKAAVQESGIKELVGFVESLADDAMAVAHACTEPWSNGMVEGFNHKVKWIKRSSYGQAGFPLLQRRVLLHPQVAKPGDTKQGRRSSQRSASVVQDRASGARSPRTADALLEGCDKRRSYGSL